MAWLQLQFTTPSSIAEELEEQLTVLGAIAVTFQDAADEPLFAIQNETTLLWQQTIVTGLFTLDTDLDHLLATLRAHLSTIVFATKQIDFVADKNWLGDYRQHWQPLKFGNNLWVCPSWQKVLEPNAVVVELDPGMAFGTGSHATTALCLEWLENNVNPATELVIDYGCGSGILALAALKLGARQVIAIDNDNQALTATLENAKRNQISPSALIALAPHPMMSVTADILVANILAQPLIELVTHFVQLLKPQGYIVLSGILLEQAGAVLDAYIPGFEMSEPVAKEGWVRLVGKRRK